MGTGAEPSDVVVVVELVVELEVELGEVVAPLGVPVVEEEEAELELAVVAVWARRKRAGSDKSTACEPSLSMRANSTPRARVLSSTRLRES
jgi:hypothetical protein